jgi:hypothetical protein
VLSTVIEKEKTTFDPYTQPDLIMLANSSGGSRLGHQPGERRASGFGFGYSHQPLSHPQKAQRGGTQEMVQMGLG